MDPKLVKEINRIFHELEAEEYEAKHPEVIKGDRKWWEDFGEKFIRPLANAKSISILDIGCGTGFVGEIILRYLTSKDRFYGYDLSWKMLIKARENLNDKCFLAKKYFLNGDAETLSFKNESFDLITVNAVLHHLPDYPALLKEIDRVLTKGGLLALAHELNVCFLTSRWVRLLAIFYKLSGGGKKISDAVQWEVNAQLKANGLIERHLSKDEIIGLVDYHSPFEQRNIALDSRRGLVPQQILATYFASYSVLELREYSTFFHRPFLEKNKILQSGLRFLNNLFFSRRGTLFSFVIKKDGK